MHFSSTVFLLPLLSSFAAADQVPLKDKAAAWLEKARGFIPNPGPIDAGAAAVAEQKVERINLRNYERKLAPKLDTEEEWMVFVTGGNKSCFGRCTRAELTWNVSLNIHSSIRPLNL